MPSKTTRKTKKPAKQRVIKAVKSEVYLKQGNDWLQLQHQDGSPLKLTPKQLQDAVHYILLVHKIADIK